MTFNKIKITILFLLVNISLHAQTPATEVRAVWLTTNWALDWPTLNTNVESQKRELIQMLDRLKALNFNVVLFQVRSQGNVMYKSSIEPFSPYITSKVTHFDPLAFAVRECHKRGIECHAWLITYPMQRIQTPAKESIPNYYKQVDDRWHLDPGRPETRSLLLSITKEIVENYDIDGIHYDYIRYPNSNGKFPDSDTYREYGNGMPLADWRRENINKLVFEIYDEVKSIKNWVQVSSAPLGRYRVLPEISLNDGWTAYETVFQDTGHWMKRGKQDLVFPMMYHRERYFYPFLLDWIDNSNDRIVVPGLGLFQMMPGEFNWSLAHITNQMEYIRKNNVAGMAYFRVANILEDLKGIESVIKNYYPNPAKLPPLLWLDDVAPSPPKKLQVYKENGILNIEWDAPNNEETFTYNVYVSNSTFVDVNNSKNILTTGLRGNRFTLPAHSGEYGLYYSVTASDRYHNESLPCPSGFFVFMDEEK